jgi:pimeloyl-ACP methyl ester carboxylesterase
MDDIAVVIKDFSDKLNIQRCTIIGHSMGGYVMLAFAELFPERINKIVLFHSSVYTDLPEKKSNRLNDIKIISLGNLNEIVDNHIPKTFATDNVKIHKNIINKLKVAGKQNNPNGVISLINAMINRKDRQDFIKQINKPVCFIFGKKDNFISVDAAKKMILLNKKIYTIWLKKSGHMGFIEEKEKTLQTILNFINL